MMKYVKFKNIISKIVLVIWELQNMGNSVVVITNKKKINSPEGGLEPPTLRLKV